MLCGDGMMPFIVHFVELVVKMSAVQQNDVTAAHFVRIGTSMRNKLNGGVSSILAVKDKKGI